MSLQTGRALVGALNPQTFTRSVSLEESHLTDYGSDLARNTPPFLVCRRAIMGGLKAEELLCLAYIQAATGLTVWLGRIPNDFAVKADLCRNHLCQVPNGNLFSGPRFTGSFPS